jgi:hypothetical protein
MTANKLRALAAALLLGTAGVGAGAMLTAAPAEAAGVRAAVGTPLQDALNLAAQANYKAALAKVSEAEAVANKTPDETAMIAQVKQYIGVKSGDASIGGAPAAKAKFNNDYNAKKYADVIADADLLKKNGALDAQSMQVVAQSYYLLNNNAGCVKYIKSNFGHDAGEDTLQLLMRCAYQANDEDTQRDALEQLVGKTGKPDYWSSLLKLAEQTKTITDHQSLDVYRIKFLTGTLASKDEYTLLAQLSIQLGFPAEAVDVIQKGMSANQMNDDKSKRLLVLAQQQAAASAAGQAAALAAATKAPMGDDLIKVAEVDWSMGKYADGIDAATAGLKKNLKDKDNAGIVLGMNYIGAGKKELATKTLEGVKGSDNDTLIAHLWSLYGQTAKPAAAAKK